MKVSHTEWIHLDDQGRCSAQHLTEVSGLSHAELGDLIDNELIVPIDAVAEPKQFALQYLVVANRARRLRDDFELDRHGVALALTLILRIDALEQELRALRTA